MRYKVIALVLMMVGLACQAQNQMDKQGRRQGHWVKTDKQGAKIYEGEFVDDMETGTFTYFYPNGKIRIQNEYIVAGKICKHKVYDEDGHLLATGNFNQKNRDGLWEFYSINGKLLKKTTYKMGVRNGLQVLFTSEGDTAEVCNWSDNHRNGRWWKRIGTKGWITATYVNGLIEGRLVEYNDAQQLVREGNYTNGLRNGSWNYFEDNKVVVRERWSNGTMRDREIRLLLPEERFVSIYDINYIAAQGKKKTIIYLTSGTKLTDEEPAEVVFGRIGSERFTLANKDNRIMVATNLVIGTTRDREGREILNLDPKPDFDIFPDDDCMRMLKSLKLQRKTEEDGGAFDFEN